MKFRLLKTMAFVFSSFWGPGFSQGCNTLPPVADFTMEEIARPTGGAYDVVVAKDLKVYWVERHGAFKVWDPATRQEKLIKQFEVLSKNPTTGIYGDVETGLQGLLLAPDFETSHWVYIWYSVPASKLGNLTPHALGPIERLSRFTLKNNNTELDAATEKVIFEVKNFAQCCHFGGTMKWGPEGSLYLSTGDNIHYENTGTGIERAYNDAFVYTDPRNTSSNTNDTRGKLLRIKPLPFPDTQNPAPGLGTTYEVPPGNLREFWNTAEKEKVRPEIYSMGHRNPFTIAVNPANGWVVMGEANGDNETYGEDEINLITKPGNFGWPYLIGNNVNYIPDFWNGKPNPAKSAQGIVNDSRFNTGAKTLPPAVSALISTRTTTPNFPSMNCFGVTWGWVAFDSTSQSTVKWPTYLAGKLLIGGWRGTDLKAATLDASGKIIKLETLFSGRPFNTNIMRVTQGSDGAFYVSSGGSFGFDNSARIFKVGYRGPCNPVSIPKPDFPPVLQMTTSRRHLVHLGSTKVALPAGVKQVQAFDLQGRLVWVSARLDEPRAAEEWLPAYLPKGMLHLRYLEAGPGFPSVSISN